MCSEPDRSIGPYGHARIFTKTGQFPHPTCVTWNVLKVAIANRNLMYLAKFCEKTLLQRLTILNYKDYLRRALYISVSWEMRLTLIMYYDKNAAQINETEDICVVIYHLNGLLELFEYQCAYRGDLFRCKSPLRLQKIPKRRRSGACETH